LKPGDIVTMQVSHRGAHRVELDELQMFIPPEYPSRAVDFVAVDNSTGVTLYGELKSPWAKYVQAKEFIAGSLAMKSVVFPKTYSTAEIDQLAHDLVLFTDSLTESDPLDGYEKYAVEDWDGYDALPITAETLHAARSILKSLPKTFGDPVCSPGADGSIVFEWLKDDGPVRKLFIDIGPGRTWKAYWRLASGKTGTIPRKRVSISTIPELQKLFETLLRGCRCRPRTGSPQTRMTSGCGMSPTRSMSVRTGSRPATHLQGARSRRALKDARGITSSPAGFSLFYKGLRGRRP